MKNSKFVILPLAAALTAEILLIYIIYLNPVKMSMGINPVLQSYLSAIFNALSAVSLGVGFYFIKMRKDKKNHIVFIHLALIFSALFLVNYIIYHLNIGHVKFVNTELRFYYLFLLGSHLIASIISLPLIFLTYSFAIFKKFKEHKKIAKMTFVLWEYVSITGVLVVLALRFLNH